MSRKICTASLMALLIAALYVGAMAQGRGSAQGMGGMRLGQSNIVSLEGKVKQMQIAPGQRNSLLVLSQFSGGDVTIFMGPYHILVDENFNIAVGSDVAIQAFQSPRLQDTYVAVQIKDLKTGAIFNLRNANGMPMGAGRGFGGNGRSSSAGTCQAQLDLANKTSLEGTVQSVSMGLNQGFPHFTMALKDGKTVTIVASPFRTLLDSKFKIAIDDRMSVLAFPSLMHEGAYVAAELKNLTNGTILTLRDAQGLPVDCSGCTGSSSCEMCPHRL